MNERYEAWNDALIREYFPPGHLGRLAYLPLDDDELKAMARPYGLCEPEAAVESFVSAVLSECEKRGLGRFAAGVAGWRRVREHPPYVAGLGLCVLAASRMATDDAAHVASHNYYTQLNRLIGRGDHDGQPKGFDALSAAWTDLARWLDDDCAGHRGSSTIRTLPHHKHIGYPLSQCLLRAVDRRRLPDFFKAAGLTPSSEISADRLFSLLRAWATQPSCGLSSRARSAIARAQDIDLSEIAETVERELRAWDGELRDARGRRRGPIHLLVIPRGRRGTIVTLIPRRPSGFPAGRWRIAGTGGEVELNDHHADGWFQPLDIRITSRLLESGLQLVRDDLALTFDAAEALPCRQAEIAIGGYLSQPGAVMWEPHLAVARRSVAGELAEYLGRFTDGGSPPVQHDRSNLPPEWAVIREFRLTQVPQNPPPRFARFAPRLLSTTSFEGGLRVSPRDLSPPIYLTGGEPDVNVSVDPCQELSVTLDGIPQALRGGAVQLPLSDMRLQPGPHELIADVTRRFTCIDSFGDTAPVTAGSLGYRLSRHRGYLPESSGAQPLNAGAPPRGVLHVSGALALGCPEDLPLEHRRPVLARAGKKDYVVIGASPDELARPAGTRAPAWLKPLKLDDVFQFIEIHAPFAAVWLLTESRDGSLKVEALGDLVPPRRPPSAREADWPNAVMRWSDAAVGDADAGPWRDYVAVAAASVAEARH